MSTDTEVVEQPLIELGCLQSLIEQLESIDMSPAGRLGDQGDLPERRQLLAAAKQLKNDVRELNRRSESLARAQAEAIVYSAEIIQELEDTKRKLKKKATHDNLTGLCNRHCFRTRIDSWINKGDECRFAVCFLDLDDFKCVNDTLGHEIGDQLLKSIAHRLRKTFGRQCLLARFGGDEFAMLVRRRNVDCGEVEELMRRAMMVFHQPFKLEESLVHVGVSIGTTLYPEHAADASSLMKNADLAMYAAKACGKNHHRFFCHAMKAEVESRQRLQTELRQAVNNDQLSLDFQPVVRATDGRLLGCEALARWRIPGQVERLPGEFIPIAEETGLIKVVGRHVFQVAARQLIQWRECDMKLARVAINLSPRQLRDPSLVRHIEAWLHQTGSEPNWFELEITENAIMDDMKLASKTIHRLSELGFRIALDDFGTGYSSLGRLNDFPFDTLKIDLSFIRGLPDDNTAVAITRSIISLGKGLGLTTIAEGVETEQQRKFLAEEGCDAIQGYLISRPLMPDAFAKWVSEHDPCQFGLCSSSG